MVYHIGGCLHASFNTGDSDMEVKFSFNGAEERLFDLEIVAFWCLVG